MPALYVKRCATVVSLTQLNEDKAEAAAAQSTALLAVPAAAEPEPTVADIAGRRVALYEFATQPSQPKQQFLRCNSDGVCMPCVPDMDDVRPEWQSALSGAAAEDEDAVPNAGSASARAGWAQDGAQEVPTASMVGGDTLLDTALLALWEDCAEQGLFRYDVTACPTKVLPGAYGFVAQLNEGRATKKRPTEFRVDQVCQPFDPSKFNFNKAYLREVLFQFEPSQDGRAHLVDSAPASSSPNLVVINVSPIEYGHVLLVPRVADCIPQLVDQSTVLLALRFAHEAGNPYFRVGYNSLGAYATINHLHFQAYYLAAPYPCERAPTTPLMGLKRKRGVHVTRLTDYPVNGFVVEVGDSLEAMAAVVAHACIQMQRHNVPHNLLITDCGERVFIWPQCYAEKQATGTVPEDILETGVNPATFEIAGHLVLKRAEDYSSITQDFAWRMLEEVSLPEERFLEVAQLCFG